MFEFMKLGSTSVNVSTSTSGKKEYVNPGDVSESSSLQKELLISMIAFLMHISLHGSFWFL
jgi:hypothetical protein